MTLCLLLRVSTTTGLYWSGEATGCDGYPMDYPAGHAASPSHRADSSGFSRRFA
jgi:hypothetical protein